MQPYYVIDTQRLLTSVELLKRDQIKSVVIVRYPKIKDLFMPSILQYKEEIKPNEELMKHYQNILKRQGLGSQHYWLALLVDANKITGMEICNHKNDPATTIIAPSITKKTDGDSVYYCVNEDYGDNSVYHLFKYFRFPLLPMTKTKIEQKARGYGFSDLMELYMVLPSSLGLPTHGRKALRHL